MMCAARTPAFTASRAQRIFGSMPPVIVPSAISASTRRGSAPVSSAVGVEHARVLVSRISFSAPQDLGHLAGDQVGVDVVGLAVGADADGRDHRDEVAATSMSTTPTSMLSTSPT
jgi:hypothetical protein